MNTSFGPVLSVLFSLYCALWTREPRLCSLIRPQIVVTLHSRLPTWQTGQPPCTATSKSSTLAFITGDILELSNTSVQETFAIIFDYNFESVRCIQTALCQYLVFWWPNCWQLSMVMKLLRRWQLSIFDGIFCCWMEILFCHELIHHSLILSWCFLYKVQGSKNS